MTPRRLRRGKVVNNIQRRGEEITYPEKGGKKREGVAEPLLTLRRRKRGKAVRDSVERA